MIFFKKKFNWPNKRAAFLDFPLSHDLKIVTALPKRYISKRYKKSQMVITKS